MMVGVYHTYDMNRGFTLIEIIIAVFVLGVAALVFLSAFNTLVLTRSVKHQDVAARIASQEIEDLRAVGYSSLPTSGTFTNSLSSELPSPQLALVVSDYNASIKKTVVTVSWQEVGQGTRSVVLSTLITNTGGL
jgi:prepilin-type N-terminal cleavage/methylation domain-containing protein